MSLGRSRQSCFGAPRWLFAKRALRDNYGIASHVSSTHNGLWSCIRYGFVRTANKQTIDETPYIWSSDGSWPAGLVRAGTNEHALLWRAAQRPFNAKAHEARSAAAQKAKVVGSCSVESKRRIVRSAQGLRGRSPGASVLQLFLQETATRLQLNSPGGMGDGQRPGDDSGRVRDDTEPPARDPQPGHGTCQGRRSRQKLWPSRSNPVGQLPSADQM